MGTVACACTLYMAWPVLAAPAQRLFGSELVGRFHDPFTVIRMFAAPLSRFSLYTQPLTDWVGALFAAVFGAVAAYNFVVLVTFPVAALATFGLARSLGCRVGGATLAALAFAFAPAHLAHAAYHPHIAQVQWIPLFLWAVWNACRRPGMRSWSLAAGALLAMGLANFYFGWFGAVLLPVAVLTAPQTGVHRRRTAVVLAALCVGAGLLLLTPAWDRFRESHGFSLDDAVRYAALPRAYVLPAVDHAVLGDLARGVHASRPASGDALLEQQQSVSWALVALCVVAIATWWRRRDDPALRYLPALLGVGVAAFLFSLPPRVGLAGGVLWLPSGILHWAAPMFRAYARFGFFLQLAVCLGAAIGFDRLWRSGARARILATVLAVVVAFEYLPAPPWRWRPVLPTEAHRSLVAEAVEETVLDCLTPAHAVASIAAFVPARLRAPDPDRLDCDEPDLAAKLAALGVARVIREAEAQVAAGLTLHRRHADSSSWRVTADPARVYVSRLSGFSWREAAAGRSYRWMGSEGSLIVVVSKRDPRPVTWRVELASFPENRALSVRVDGREAARWTVEPDFSWFEIGPLTLQPGVHTVQLHAAEAPAIPDELLGNGDTRPLAIALGAWSWSES